LEKQYGSTVWREHLKQSASMQEAMIRQNEHMASEVTEINRKRKFSQLNQTDHLSVLEEKYWRQLDKNKLLESEIARIEDQLEARKVMKRNEGSIDE
jgi:hypothetical protein